MKKFFVLIKKEIRELMTPQVLVPMLLTVLIFVFIGKVAGSEIKKSQKPTNVAVMDLDNSEMSGEVLKLLSSQNLIIHKYTGTDESKLVEFAKENNSNAAFEIPKNFEGNIIANRRQELKTFVIIKNFSFTGSRDAAILDGAVATINNYVSDQIILQKNGTDFSPSVFKNPIYRSDNVVVGNKQAAVSPAAVMGFVSSQTALIPIILFIVIIFAATMIATAIATEKENKTLETLLTAPVSRKYLVSAKMIGAGFVALISAAVYMFGFRYYMNGISGASGAQDQTLMTAVNQLGLTFNLQGYLILGGTLFLAILCALAIATILGAFAEDAKSVQGLISPLMLLIMVPYFLSLFTDISSATPAIKTLIYAIPFSYPFLAAPNIFLHNYSLLFYGMAYQLVFFVVFVYIAAKIFSTDKIITMKLNFSKKRN